MSEDIRQLREEIDSADEQIVALLKKRMSRNTKKKTV